jgi:hypothetical protein
MLIGPQIRVFIDMDQFKSWLEPSFVYCFNPEIEGVIVVIKNSRRDRRVFEAYKMFESAAGFQDTIFYFFKYNLISDCYIS